eukprot:TRINITY_DN22985_c0_g3_i2.p1 TRINITY_DN22985_c0_g3~~TRINITY_DN22985_c0_g3_i2.p1  ORF type:complete len:383 (-),score=28.88 TRINITY_DN22985_c0_g3_i2:407-1522(-)
MLLTSSIRHHSSILHTNKSSRLLRTVRKQGYVQRKQCATYALINKNSEFVRRRERVEDGMILVDDENEPQIYAFWDLCDKYDQILDPFSLTQNVYLALSKYGSVDKLYAYGQDKMLKSRPYDIQKKKRLEYEENPLSKKKKIIKPYSCGVCGGGFMTYEKLQRHFKIHTKQRQKEMGHKKTKQKRMTNSRESKYQSAFAKMQNERDPQTQGDVLQILREQDTEVFWVNSPNQAVQKIKEDIVATKDLLLKAYGVMGISQQEYIIAIISDQDFEKQIKIIQEGGLSSLIVARASERPRIRKYADYYIRWEQIERLTQKLYEEKPEQQLNNSKEDTNNSDGSKRKREYVLQQKTPSGKAKRRYDPMLGMFTEW